MYSRMILSTLIVLGVSTGWAQSSTVKAPAQKKSAATATTATQTQAQTLTSEIKPSARTAPVQNISLSQHMIVPAAGQTAMQVQLQSMNTDLTYRLRDNSKQIDTRKGLMAGLRWDKGTQNGWGLNAAVSAPLGEVTESHTGFKEAGAKGLSDIQVGATKVIDRADGQMFYGGTFSLSPTERVWATEFESGNNNSGGHTLAGFIGRQAQINPKTVLGGRVRHEMALDRSESAKVAAATRATITRTGGNITMLEGFTERAQGTAIWGATAGLGFHQTEDMTYRQGTNPRQEFTSDAYNSLNLSAYARLPLKEMPGLEILPAVSYSKPINASGGSMSLQESSEVSQISVGTRWAL